MKLSFSSLGCPEWSFDTILERAHSYGYDGIAFRGVAGELDLAKVPEFAPARRVETRRRLADQNLRPEMMLASTRLVLASAGEREAGLASAKEHIDIAADLGAPFVRVFGGPLPDGCTREQARDWAVEGLRSLGDYAAGTGVVPLLETHDDFSKTDRIAEVLELADHPHVGILWDIHHPFRIGGERIADSWARVSKWTRHCDIKDSRVDTTARLGYRYVLIGEGETPLTEALQLLKAARYHGSYTFEWEKKWHPELQEPEIALPDYIAKMKKFGQELHLD